MQVWCDLRTTPSIEELHPVFDSKLTVNGEQFSLNGNAISYDSELVGELVAIRDSNSYNQARALIGLVKWLVVELTDWKMIPIENLIAECEDSGTMLGVVVNHTEDVNGIAFALERGADAIIIKPEDSLIEVCMIAKSLRLENQTKSNGMPIETNDSIKLTKGKIVNIESGGIGERYCIDLTCLISIGEGMLIGSSASSLALVHGEVISSQYVPSRPFRVNAGPPHSYVLMADGKTKYIAELTSGDEVMLVSDHGESRAATIGRLKIEKRPFLRISWENDYQISNSIYLQQAETVRVVAGEGQVVSVTNLAVGDSILCHNSQYARHIGNQVSISSKEV